MIKQTYISTIFVYILFIISINANYAQELEDFKELKGKVIDSETHESLVFADVLIENSNVSTVTNSKGEFSLKILEHHLNDSITISYLGYQKTTRHISTFQNHKKIELKPVTTVLDLVSITATTKDAKHLVVECLSKKSSLYSNKNTLMTAFYRETIKNKRKNVSLSEAVIQIHKYPYNSTKSDDIELIKARKNTNYKKLDTLALKLQGGPFSNIYMDIIKYPEFIFTNESLPLYDFKFGNTTKINERLIYVIHFKQIENTTTPIYYGKLFIDAKTLALTNAVFSLNISNKILSSNMFIRNKPGQVEVYPTEITYRVNYRTSHGKWHYAYSNISLTFKVNWDDKLFSSTYTLNSEMAITNWTIQDTKFTKTRNRTLKPSSILSERASGFSDPSFWGTYNIIEPEKSIQSAINKIQKQLKST